MNVEIDGWIDTCASLRTPPDDFPSPVAIRGMVASLSYIASRFSPSYQPSYQPHQAPWPSGRALRLSLASSLY